MYVLSILIPIPIPNLKLNPNTIVKFCRPIKSHSGPSFLKSHQKYIPFEFRISISPNFCIFSGYCNTNTMANEGNGDENFKEKSIRLEEFPNELLMKIFIFLEITNLLKCSQISKRIRAICYESRDG